MNLGKFFVSLLGLQSAIGSTDFETSEKISKPVNWPVLQDSEEKQIITAVNSLRRNVRPKMANPKPIVWDNDLEASLKAFLPTNRTWLFTNSTLYTYPVDIRVRYNLLFLMKEPEFKNYTGYNYIWHDTCNNKVGDVLRIFKYRIKQLSCMNFNKCSPTEFTNYITCLAKPVPRKESLKCSWAWRYVSPLVSDDLDTMACVRFSHPGPSTPNGQKDSFGCYGKMKTPTNDVPYKMKING